ncbi:MAG TPA: ATP-binding protein [Candidatus Moranbacteria bacterium]|nr:ATP-binding protein [Candidatus Moranbacteria bacterium]
MKDNKSFSKDILKNQLELLKLPFCLEHFEDISNQAAKNQLSHLDFLAQLIEGETVCKQKRSIERKINQSKFPFIKSLSDYDFTFPKKINEAQVKHVFHLDFIRQKANIILIGGVGVGKTHLGIALGYQACLKEYSVLFASAIDIINALSAAKTLNRLKFELQKYLRVQVLIIDELGYLPIDQLGADLLFQIFSKRYEKGSIVLTTNKVFKKWPSIFNNDSTITSAVLDRLLHHAETVIIEGPSYRMKDQNPEY